jgi:hypothetical protein
MLTTPRIVGMHLPEHAVKALPAALPSLVGMRLSDDVLDDVIAGLAGCLLDPETELPSEVPDIRELAQEPRLLLLGRQRETSLPPFLEEEVPSVVPAIWDSWSSGGVGRGRPKAPIG